MYKRDKIKHQKTRLGYVCPLSTHDLITKTILIPGVNRVLVSVWFGCSHAWWTDSIIGLTRVFQGQLCAGTVFV